MKGNSKLKAFAGIVFGFFLGGAGADIALTEHFSPAPQKDAPLAEPDACSLGKAPTEENAALFVSCGGFLE